ncbi:MBL fold metallo-hydrolase [bacterium]|nr:MBL fold metallo-hydrolase [bacterium]
MRTGLSIFLLSFLLTACNSADNQAETHEFKAGVSVIVLGNVQDAGSPHIACEKSCCTELSEKEAFNRLVSCLGLVDFELEDSYLFDASPDLTQQLKLLQDFSDFETEIPTGVFLTHAHIGHYTGLMYFGREAVSADSVPVYVMPGMQQFLESNGPWDQLVNLGNIKLKGLDTTGLTLNKNIRVTPICVPHRDEYSETVGFLIDGPNKTLLFIPDIDKWDKWIYKIETLIENVDYALIDGTFYDNEELPNRDMSEIPHPFVIESMALFQDLPAEEKNKVWFIHFNHTNPLLDQNSSATKEVEKLGFNVARLGDTFQL